jgi:hypothetical protein
MGRELQPGLHPEGEDGRRARAARADDSSAGEDDVVRVRSRASGCGQADGLPEVAECIAIALIPQARAGLQLLQARTKLSPTDITNRAITLYEFIDAQLSAGRELLLRDEETGEVQRVLIA